MDDDEQFAFGRPPMMGPRPPMGPRVRSEREPEQGHHGKHGHHGRRKHCPFMIFATIFGAALFAGHFYSIRCLKREQVALEKITGKKECGWGKWKKKCGGFQKPVQVAQQPVVVEYSPVVQNSTMNTESSIEEVSEDKEIGIVYAPNPTGIYSNQNQMV